jgi:hypothetical protein
LTQTLQPPRPAIACSVAPGGSLRQESRVNSSPPSIKLPSRTSNSSPPGIGTAIFAGRLAFHENKFPGVLVQERKFDSREAGRVRERKGGGVDTHWRPVIWVELPELDEDRATRLRSGRMAAGRRVANISTRRVVAVLILKYALALLGWFETLCWRGVVWTPSAGQERFWLGTAGANE